MSYFSSGFSPNVHITLQAAEGIPHRGGKCQNISIAAKRYILKEKNKHYQRS